MNVIETRGLEKAYGSDDTCVHALRGIDLRVQHGEFLAIMGPSGSGKSTFLHILGGVETPTDGQVLLEGTDLATLDDDERTLIRRTRIGFISGGTQGIPGVVVDCYFADFSGLVRRAGFPQPGRSKLCVLLHSHSMASLMTGILLFSENSRAQDIFHE